MSAPRIIACRNGLLPAGELREVGRHLRSGGLLAYPTETVYGLGGLVQDGPLRALAALKRRDADKPFLLLLPDPQAAAGLVWNRCARRLAERLWPGPLTLVLPDPGHSFPAQVRGGSGGVAVRMSPAPVARQILDEVGAPITSTSANPPGGAPARSRKEAWETVRALAADERLWVVDAGELPPAPASAIVDCTARDPVVLRAGALDLSELREICPSAREDADVDDRRQDTGERYAEVGDVPPDAATKDIRLLYVCTGNTCRSPMAEVLTRARARQRGLSGIRVRSAGTMAYEGSPASAGARTAVGDRGLELDHHAARLLGEDELEWADLVLAMSPSHLAAVESLGRGRCYAEVITAFAGDVSGGVADPFGGSDDHYRDTCAQLERLIEAVLDRLDPGTDA
ncbi:MAG: Sua5/YciO/YrdC/YwlC family protein [Gammaproteobacteria bacterium]|nr:Sua5/YciO/YrdC/YwlC family protein [Gammaproteobacteria bacterium]MDE0258169.1 Sua5/YciO/YrdC/YwlC family protein [Gammaproteobacteria bacterium]